MSDDELISRSAQYESLSELASYERELNRHLLGRNLLGLLKMVHPKFISNYIVGREGRVYRSKPELIAGNFLLMQEVEFDQEVTAGLFLKTEKGTKSTKSIVSDFYIGECDRFLEIIQNSVPDGKGRRTNYAKRWKEKEELYGESGISPIVINSGKYYQRGLFDIRGFVDELTAKLKCEGIFLRKKIDIGDLVYRDTVKAKNILTAENSMSVVKLLIGYGYRRPCDLDLTATGRAIHNILISRDDYTIIKTLHREVLMEGYSEAKKRKTRERDSQLPNLEYVQDFFKRNGIRAKDEWVQFAKVNRALLLEFGIPAEPRTPYLRRGDWKGWAYLTGSDG